VIKKQNDQDTAMGDLYEMMMVMLKAASQEDILRERGEFTGHFEKMAKVSIECSLFIAGYSSGSYYSTFMHGNFFMIHRETKIKPWNQNG
jgi:hypothetical protein